MHYLVKFIEDNVYFVSNKLKKRNSKYFAKWLDGNFYEALHIITSSNKNDLMKFAYNLENDLPKIYLIRSNAHRNFLGKLVIFCNLHTI